MGRFFTHPTPVAQAVRLRDSHYALDLDAMGLRAQLHAVTLPIRVLWGLDDPLLPPSTLDRLRADLPQARIERVLRAGHIPMGDRPQAVADSIVRWLRRVAPTKKRDDRRTATPLSPDKSR